VHVKPYHIEGQYVKKPLDEREASLKDGMHFFQAAKTAGYARVVLGYRENILQRKLSSYELNKENYYWRLREQVDMSIESHLNTAPKSLPQFNVTKAISQIHGGLVHMHDRLYVAALMAGYDVHFFSFADVVSDPCKTICRILRDFIGCTEYTNICEETCPVSRLPHSHQALEHRIGDTAAHDLTVALSATPYAWMLDSGAHDWPVGVARPLSSMPMPLLAAGGTKEMLVEYNLRYAGHKKYLLQYS
jgi:hypothetical protein